MSDKEPFDIIRARHYATTFSGDSGEFVIQDLMKFCGMLSDGFSSVPGETQYNSGRRSAICYIMEKLQLDELHVLNKSKLNSVLNREFKNSLEFEETDVTDYEKASFRE